jgi:hypothetical protein
MHFQPNLILFSGLQNFSEQQKFTICSPRKKWQLNKLVGANLTLGTQQDYYNFGKQNVTR